MQLTLSHFLVHSFWKAPRRRKLFAHSTHYAIARVLMKNFMTSWIWSSHPVSMEQIRKRFSVQHHKVPEMIRRIKLARMNCFMLCSALCHWQLHLICGDGMQRSSTYHRRSLDEDREFDRLSDLCSLAHSALDECRRNSGQNDPGRSSGHATCNTPGIETKKKLMNRILLWRLVKQQVCWTSCAWMKSKKNTLVTICGGIPRYCDAAEIDWSWNLKNFGVISGKSYCEI